MIPRVAYFYWTGGPLPWLRAQSMVTFQRHHPEWRVVLGSPEDRDTPPGVALERDDVTRADLPPAARSDWWRWHVLGTRGGFYADTDVLFVRSVEPLLTGAHDAWITTDGGTPTKQATGWRWTYKDGKRVSKQPGGPRLSIGVLAAPVGGSHMFSRARALAAGMAAGDDYQSHGTGLLAEHWLALSRGVSVGPLPFDCFYRGWSDEDVRALWSPGPVKPHEIGVHWYGGSVESRPHEGAQSVEDLPDSVVRSVFVPGNP